MTDTLAKPQLAWAVVDKDGAIVIPFITDSSDEVKRLAPRRDGYFPEGAPHRVARVLITEIKDGYD